MLPSLHAMRLSSVLDTGCGSYELEEGVFTTGQSWEDVKDEHANKGGYWIVKMRKDMSGARSKTTTFSRPPKIMVKHGVYNITLQIVGYARFIYKLDLDDLRSRAMKILRRGRGDSDALDDLIKLTREVFEDVDAELLARYDYNYLLSPLMQDLVFEKLKNSRSTTEEWIRNLRQTQYDRQFDEVLDYESTNLDRGVTDAVFLAILDDIAASLGMRARLDYRTRNDLFLVTEASGAGFDFPDEPVFSTDVRYSRPPIYFVMGKLDELEVMNEGDRKSTLGLFWNGKLIAIIKYQPPRGFFLFWKGALENEENLVRRYAKHLAHDMTNRESVLFKNRYDPRSPQMTWRFTSK